MTPTVRRVLRAAATSLALSGLLGCLDGKSPTPPPRVPKPKVALEARPAEAGPDGPAQRPAKPMLRAITSFMISLVPP